MTANAVSNVAGNNRLVSTHPLRTAAELDEEVNWYLANEKWWRPLRVSA